MTWNLGFPSSRVAFNALPGSASERHGLVGRETPEPLSIAIRCAGPANLIVDSTESISLII